MSYNNENWKGTSIYDFIKFHNEHKKPKIDIDLNKIVYEDFTVGNIINELSQSVMIIMESRGWEPKFKSTQDLIKWIKGLDYPENTNFDEVIIYFENKYKLLNK